ncbi:hypothetical protein V6U81_03700 [Micromonospora sp. CPCC 205711]|uniref:hypothetical protein n=1 Tax=Micromonospora sp. CPCC 205547 TaxID=3122400 RepID=UPI002FF18DC0
MTAPMCGVHLPRTPAGLSRPEASPSIAEGDVELTLDGIFEFGLGRLLDGFAALVEGGATPG